MEGIPAQILSYDEDTNVILLSMGVGHVMIQLDSMKLKNISKIDHKRHEGFIYYPTQISLLQAGELVVEMVEQR